MHPFSSVQRRGSRCTVLGHITSTVVRRVRCAANTYQQYNRRCVPATLFDGVQVVMALLGLAAIPGFIALATVENNKKSAIESVTVPGGDRSLGGADGGSQSTLLSTSSMAPSGCVFITSYPSSLRHLDPHHTACSAHTTIVRFCIKSSTLKPLPPQCTLLLPTTNCSDCD